MAKFKPGDYFAPKPGSTHHKMYGNFVGRVTHYEERIGDLSNWEVIEEGFGVRPIVKGTRPHSDDSDMMNITAVYNSPLWNALK